MQNHHLQNRKNYYKRKQKKATLDVRYKHGKSHSAGVPQTHVQLISNVNFLPQAAKKLDTPSTINHSHDNCQVQHSPHTMPTDRTREELVISIPLDVEEDNEESATYDTIIQPQSFNDNPEEIDFPLEYFTNPEQNVTSLSLNKLLKTSS